MDRIQLQGAAMTNTGRQAADAADVANASTGTITPIRTATGTALTRIRLADGAGPIAITPAPRR
jgi:hypothetical protein